MPLTTDSPFVILRCRLCGETILTAPTALPQATGALHRGGPICGVCRDALVETALLYREVLQRVQKYITADVDRWADHFYTEQQTEVAARLPDALRPWSGPLAVIFGSIRQIGGLVDQALRAPTPLDVQEDGA